MPGRGNRHSIFETRPESSSERTIALSKRHTSFLDRIAVDAHLRHHVWMLRSEIVYAVIEAAIRSGNDLSEAASQDEIKALMMRRAARRSYPSGSTRARNRLPGRGRKQ